MTAWYSGGTSSRSEGSSGAAVSGRSTRTSCSHTRSASAATCGGACGWVGVAPGTGLVWAGPGVHALPRALPIPCWHPVPRACPVTRIRQLTHPPSHPPTLHQPTLHPPTL